FLERRLADQPEPGLSLGERLVVEDGMVPNPAVDGEDPSLAHGVTFARQHCARRPDSLRRRSSAGSIKPPASIRAAVECLTNATSLNRPGCTLRMRAMD